MTLRPLFAVLYIKARSVSIHIQIPESYYLFFEISFKMSQIYIFAILFISATFGADPEPSPKDCLLPSKKMGESLKLFSDQCAKELKVDVEDLPKSPEDLVAKNFDDKCFSKCLYEKLDLIEKDEISKDKYLKMIKDDQPEAKPELIEMADKAASKCYAEQDAKDDLCKKVTKFSNCFHKESGPNMCMGKN